MVEDYVQNNFDPLLLQALDHFLELRALFVVLDRSGIGRIRREESDGIISPVLQKHLSIVASGVDTFIKFEDRHQLDRCHSEFLQIRDLLDDPREGSRILHAGCLVPGKSADMHLVDDRILHGRIGKIVFSPVIGLLDDSGMVIRFRLGGAPGSLPGHSFGIGIQDQLILVKIQSLLRVIGAVELVGVFKLFHIQSRDKDGIHISHSVGLRDPDDSVRHGLLSLEQQEVTGCCAGRCDREVHAAPHCSRAIQTVVAGPHEKAGDLIQLLFPADPHGHMRFRSYAVVFGIAAGLSFQEPPDYVKAPHND